MIANIIGSVIAAAIGFLIAFANYIFSKKVLINTPEKYSSTIVVRQILQVAFLVIVYFIGTKTQIADLAYLLIGAAVGMTVPMFFFTKKLLSFNDATKTNKTKKEDETDG